MIDTTKLEADRRSKELSLIGTVQGVLKQSNFNVQRETDFAIALIRSANDEYEASCAVYRHALDANDAEARLNLAKVADEIEAHQLEKEENDR